MSFTEAYAQAVDAVGRPRRELKLIYPQGWKDSSQPIAMLVLVGGRILKAEEWPALALVLAAGDYALGHTIEGAAFPRSATLPRIFEGQQCLLQVGEEVVITRDASTNGTLVIPPDEVRKASCLLISDAFRKAWDSPCPKRVHPNDIVLTMYAELLLVRE